MSQLSRVRKWPAVATVAGVCVLTFAGLSAAIGGTERTVEETKVVTLPKEAYKEIAPPPRTTPQSDPSKDVMEEQGSRGGNIDDVPSDAGAGTAASAGSLSLERAVGRMIMTGYLGAYPSQEVLRRARAGEIGGVILMGENVGPRTKEAISALQQASKSGTGHALVVATDQEGGSVKRFPQVGPYVPAAKISAGTARAQGRATGQGLAAVGVNTDLAPVGDVGHAGTFMSDRTFSSSAAAAAQSACAFAAGLNDGGVNATMKHFPGLGYARSNTDTSTAVVNVGGQALTSDLAPYRSCKTQLVMVSNATYPALDASGPAVFSKPIIDGLLRGQLGYTGVIISDSLTATSVTSPTTAVRAARAGVDMLLYIAPAVSALAYQKVLAAARRGEIGQAKVRSAARRIGRLTR